jgi:phosphosulfolactate phosphohydrolase-like enzyme
MEIEFNDKNQDNPDLKKIVVQENELKTWLVNYVGTKQKAKDDTVTVEMIVETLATEFPEFLMVIAEENYIRGYEQALADVEVGQTLVEFNQNK